MTAPDVRTAAQAEADKLYPQLTELENPAICKSRRLRQKAFIKGAVWGAALVAPTREQIAEAIAWSADPEYGIVDDVDLAAADAVLALVEAMSAGWPVR